MADGADTGRLTPKQAKFAALYVELGNASEAYRQAYDVSEENSEWVKVEACKLLATPNVSLTVEELQQRAISIATLNRAWVLERLMLNAKEAVTDKDYAASNKALELLGKTDEMQMFVERSNVTSDNRHHHSAEPVSPFAEHLAQMLGARAETETEKPVPD